jgi:hypothetical protein
LVAVTAGRRIAVVVTQELITVDVTGYSGNGDAQRTNPGHIRLP